MRKSLDWHKSRKNSCKSSRKKFGKRSKKKSGKKSDKKFENMSWKKSGKNSAKISRKKSEIPDYLQKYFHTFGTCYGIFLVIYFFFIFFPCNILRYFLAGFFRSNFSREI